MLPWKATFNKCAAQIGLYEFRKLELVGKEEWERLWEVFETHDRKLIKLIKIN